MKALVYEAPRQMRYREVPLPQPGPGEECLIEVHAVGICGSDMHGYLGHDPRRPAPLILGHEPAGVIVAGPGTGQRVAVNPLKTCGQCAACRAGRDNLCAQRQILSMPPREGAFAQYITSPPGNLVVLPDALAFDSACLVEPLAVGWRAAKLAAQVRPLADSPALVLGGGAIGVTSALALRAMGCPEITLVEPNPKRRARLLEWAEAGWGAAPTAASGCALNLRAEPGATTAPIVLDAVGIDATRAAASAGVLPGGVLVHIGLGSGQGGLDIRKFTLQEVTLIGSYCYSAQEFRDCAAALFDGRLSTDGWTQQRPLSEGARAFEELLAGEAAFAKTVLIPAR